MQKPSSPDSSKFDQLKTKISSQSAKLITFAKAKGRFHSLSPA